MKTLIVIVYLLVTGRRKYLKGLKVDWDSISKSRGEKFNINILLLKKDKIDWPTYIDINWEVVDEKLLSKVSPLYTTKLERTKAEKGHDYWFVISCIINRRGKAFSYEFFTIYIRYINFFVLSPNLIPRDTLLIHYCSMNWWRLSWDYEFDKDYFHAGAVRGLIDWGAIISRIQRGDKVFDFITLNDIYNIISPTDIEILEDYYIDNIESRYWQIGPDNYCKDKEILVDYYLSNIDFIYWQDYLYNPNISYYTLLYIFKNREKLSKEDWMEISKCLVQLGGDISRFKDYLDWNIISYTPDLPEDFIEENKDKVCWENLVTHHFQFSEGFIDRNWDTLYNTKIGVSGFKFYDYHKLSGRQIRSRLLSLSKPYI